MKKSVCVYMCVYIYITEHIQFSNCTEYISPTLKFNYTSLKLIFKK